MHDETQQTPQALVSVHRGMPFTTASSAEGGKPTSPSHTARAHCWLWAVQANILRGTVTFPFPGTQVPPVRPYQAVSCSVNWQTRCCTCSLTPGLTAYTMAVAVSAQATSAWSCLWSKYKVLADRRKKANKLASMTSGGPAGLLA